MNQPPLFDAPEALQYVALPLGRSPEDAYETTIRVSYSPDHHRAVVCTETVHEDTRKMVHWCMLPLASTDDELFTHLTSAVEAATLMIRELLEPF